MHPLNPLVAVYLTAIVAANLLVSHFGPSAAIANAFLFIGLDLSTRDQLHEQWHGRDLWPRMLALVVAGGLLSLLLGGSGRIALASCLAFILAGIADTLSYRRLHRLPRLWRMNGSNVVAAALDSLCFPLLAFGWPPLWGVVLGQFSAKLLGGALWALVLSRPRLRCHAPTSQGRDL